MIYKFIFSLFVTDAWGTVYTWIFEMLLYVFLSFFERERGKIALYSQLVFAALSVSLPCPGNDTEERSSPTAVKKRGVSFS